MAKKSRSREPKKQPRPVRPTTKKASGSRRSATASVPEGAKGLPEYVIAQLFGPSALQRPAGARRSGPTLERSFHAGVSAEVRAASRRMTGEAPVKESSLPRDVRESTEALAPQAKRFHGAKVSLAWFPWKRLASDCADKFGYLTPKKIRSATSLPFNANTIGLMDQLGALMGDAGRETAGDSGIPAGFTYVGQFVDHDITFDVSSTLEALTNAENIHNMRTPALDLDSVYGDGPALHPFLYAFPQLGQAATAIKFQLGSNQNAGPGGSSSNGTPAGMKTLTDFDLPRVHNPVSPAASTLTAIIGDPRNDENLIISQFHHAMLRVPQPSRRLAAWPPISLVTSSSRRRGSSRHHYQWAVVNDFLRRICGKPAVDAARLSVNAPIGSAFRMPVEFAVAAYRFGHSMIRDNYWVNFNFPNATHEAGLRVHSQAADSGAEQLGRRLQRLLRHRGRGAGEQQGAEDRQRAGQRAGDVACDSAG